MPPDDGKTNTRGGSARQGHPDHPAGRASDPAGNLAGSRIALSVCAVRSALRLDSLMRPVRRKPARHYGAQRAGRPIRACTRSFGGTPRQSRPRLIAERIPLLPAFNWNCTLGIK